MSLKRAATLICAIAPIVLCVSFYALMIARLSPPVLVPFLIISCIATFIGPVLFAFNTSLARRRRIANLILLVAILLIVVGYWSVNEKIPGGDQELVIGVLIFSFSYLTLLLKNKYDRWKIYTRSKRDSFLLSLADSLGLALLFLGVLFRLMHWPMANAMGISGIALISIGLIAWNQRFKSEVVYRKQTEDKLQESYKQLEEKQKEITDSITYARRIQQSLLAHDEFLGKNLPEHFVLYMPKDIVSGDFYWSTVVDDSVYLAVCDSTGHGVPGAFMSLLNISFLNEAINEKNIREPHKVFDYVRDRLIENISQDGAKDGMDGILLRIDRRSGGLAYAAANNTPVLVAGSKIEDHPGDKMPVGKGERHVPFTLYELNPDKGAVLYLTTDGFADQFGGPKGKKFMRSKLREQLGSFKDSPLEIQHESLRKTFTDWKGGLEQVDDVLVVGIRF